MWSETFWLLQKFVRFWHRHKVKKIWLRLRMNIFELLPQGLQLRKCLLMMYHIAESTAVVHTKKSSISDFLFTALFHCEFFVFCRATVQKACLSVSNTGIFINPKYEVRRHWNTYRSSRPTQLCPLLHRRESEKRYNDMAALMQVALGTKLSQPLSWDLNFISTIPADGRKTVWKVKFSV